MKKNLAILMMVLSIMAVITGCGKAVNPLEAAMKEAEKESMKEVTKDYDGITTPGSGNMESYSDLLEAQQKVQEAYDENAPEAGVKMLEIYAELGAKEELREFENAEAMDAPSGFPSELIYEKGKITSASESGDETYINKDITIQTTEDFKTVKDFYKNLFSQAGWKITAQSSSGSSASYEATDPSGMTATVDISVYDYSKITTVTIYYSGSIIE